MGALMVTTSCYICVDLPQPAVAVWRLRPVNFTQKSYKGIKNFIHSEADMDQIHSLKLVRKIANYLVLLFCPN
jgi:predicted esterase